MKMNQIETLNSKEFNKGIFFFPEYYFINNEKSQINLLKRAGHLRKKYNVEKLIILGYFDQEEVLKFLTNNYCKTYENHANKVKSNFFDEENENEGKVFLFRYGKKIFDKISEAMNPQFEDEQAVNPFDLDIVAVDPKVLVDVK